MGARLMAPEQIESIPDELRQRRQWVLWRYVLKPGAPKPTKVPYQPTGDKASHADPSTWCEFSDAVSVAQSYDGIGFVFSADDPYCGVDIDQCFDPQGTLRSWAVPIVAMAQECGCYIERTPSGNGLHVIGKASLPGAGRKVGGFGEDRAGAIEVYDRTRYFTVTGEQTDIGDVTGDLTPLIVMLWDRYGLERQADGKPVEAGNAVSDTEAELLVRRVLTSASSEFVGHWSGRWDAKQYAGASEARMGLLIKIAMKLGPAVTPSEVQAVALRSGLIRDEIKARGNSKWPRLAASECAKAVETARRSTGGTPVDLSRIIGGSSDEQAASGSADPVPTDIPPRRLSLAELGAQQAEPPRFLVPGWLPCRVVTLLSAHGSGGKSTIALYLAVCLAAGLPWAGLPVRRRARTLFYSCEDDVLVLHFRLQQICAALDVDMASLEGWLLIEDATESDNIFYTSAPTASMRLTAAYHRLHRAVMDEGIDVVILDNASDVFAANEINRAEVRDFLSKLKRLANVHDEGAVLLLGHVNKESAKGNGGGQSYSGSTAWHNSVRSRWELARKAKSRPRQVDGLDEVDEQDDEDAPRILTCVKSNYGKEGHSIAWGWNHLHHTFTPIDTAPGFGAGIRRQQDRAGLLAALHDCAARHIAVPAVARGPNTCKHALELSKAFPARLKSSAASTVLRLMHELVDEGAVAIDVVRTADRKERPRFVPVGAGRDE